MNALDSIDSKKSLGAICLMMVISLGTLQIQPILGGALIDQFGTGEKTASEEVDPGLLERQKISPGLDIQSHSLVLGRLADPLLPHPEHQQTAGVEPAWFALGAMHGQTPPVVTPLGQYGKRGGQALGRALDQRNGIRVKQQGTLLIELFMAEGQQVLTPLGQQTALRCEQSPLGRVGKLVVNAIGNEGKTAVEDGVTT